MTPSHPDLLRHARRDRGVAREGRRSRRPRRREGRATVPQALVWVALALAGTLLLLSRASTLIAEAQEPPTIAEDRTEAPIAEDRPPDPPVDRPVMIVAAPPVPAPAFQSGGIGMARADWERAHGSPERIGFYARYARGRFGVGFLDRSVWRLERVWGDDAAVPVEVARGESKRFLPSDAAMLRTYTTPSGKEVDVYSSESLSERFPAGARAGHDLGHFTVFYRTRPSDGQVTSIVVRVGDNPP